jgi:predicted small metal-binding protein
MYRVICKDLGFDCDYIMNNNDKEILAINFRDHLQVGHKQYYPKNEIFSFIDIQNKKQNDREQMRKKKLTCVDDCESFRLEKWNLGHRNYP